MYNEEKNWINQGQNDIKSNGGDAYLKEKVIIVEKDQIKRTGKKGTKIFLYLIIVSLLVAGLIFAYVKLNQNVFRVEEMIDSIEEVTLDSEKIIQQVVNAYNALSVSEKSRVKNKDVLFEKKSYFELNKNVFMVERMIDNMGEITIYSGELIKEVENAYNELSESEKERVKNRDLIQKNKETFFVKYAEEFENTDLFNGYKEIFLSSFSNYNPKVSFNKTKRIFLAEMFVDSTIEETIINHPEMVRHLWSSVTNATDNLSKIGYETLSEYDIDDVIQIYSNDGSFLFYETINGETQFSILE